MSPLQASTALSVTLKTLLMFLNLAREPYDPKVSAATMTPPSYTSPTTDVPEVEGYLYEGRRNIDISKAFRTKLNP